MEHYTAEVEDRPDDGRRLTAKQQAMVAANMGLAGAVVARFPGRRRDYHAFQERLSEAYLGLCQAALVYDETRSRFSTYGTIGAQMALLRHAKQARFLGYSILDHAAPLSIDGDDIYGECDPDPDAEDEQAERVRRLHAAIDALPERTREIIRGRMRGETLRGLAARLGISYEWVRKIIWRVRHELRAAMEGGRP